MNDLKSVYADMLGTAMALGKTQADMVYGEGDANARIVLVGEAPGAEETLQHRPFVGKAGKNLDSFLEALGLMRQDIYITNVVKFRPIRVSEKGRLSNRPPTKDEVACMLPHLLREIEAVAPKVVVTLGNVPLKALSAQKGVTIGACHAQPIKAHANTAAFFLFPLYHPASIIYNRALGAVYEDDLRKLKAYISTGK